MSKSRLRTAQYCLSGVAALVIGWPFIRDASAGLSVLVFLGLTAWIASFLHIAEATPRRVLPRTIGASVLSFVVPFLVAWVSDARLIDALVGAGLIWVLGSVAALGISNRVRAANKRSANSAG